MHKTKRKFNNISESKLKRKFENFEIIWLLNI